jgi:VWFA-related protein
MKYLLAIATGWLVLIPVFLSAQPTPPTAPAGTKSNIAIGDVTKSDSIQPFAHIDLAPLGYGDLSHMERLVGNQSVVSLNFVDSNHVLLTFNPKKLLIRDPGCPPSHDDRMIHALVLEVPSGRVVKEAEWYLHDRRRFLWPLGDGRFLLRKLNSLYLVDSELHEQLLLDAPKGVAWLTVSADGKQVILETEKTPKPAKDAAQPSEDSKSKFQLAFFDIDSRTIKQTIESNRLIHLNAAGTGYADLTQKGDLWLLRFGPSPEQRTNIARVRSRCIPDVFYSSSHSLLIGRCPVKGTDYSVSAFSVTGRRLWRQHWNRKRLSPEVVHSDDSRRFAVASFTIPRPPQAGGSTADNQAENDTDPEQNIQIFDTASGNPIQSLVASPSVMSAQNFSLSPDGMRFAILHNSQIEVYDLPKVSEEEQAKATALQADVPGLYIVSKGDTDAAPNPEDPGDIGEEDPSLPVPEMTVPSAADKTSVVSPPARSVPAPQVAGKEAASEPLLTFRASTQIVPVDVVVTDSKGHPVKGLHQQDFQVLEDGKPQTPRSFHEFTGADTPRPVVSKATQKSPNIFTNISDAPDPGSVTLILLDLVNTPPVDQQFARQQLVKFLKTKPKNLQFALCTLSSSDNTHLRLIQGFTPDENVLLAAVSGSKADAKTARWQLSAAAGRSSAQSVSDLVTADSIGHWENLLSALQKMQAYEQESDTSERVTVTIEALSQLGRYLSGIPGRKNLLWLSGSFPVSFSPNPSLDNPSSENHNYMTMIHRAITVLAKGQVAVYPVDVKGLVGMDVNASSAGSGFAPGSAQSSTPLAIGQTARDGSLGIPGQTVMVSPSEAFQDQAMGELAARVGETTAMNDLAHGTGGKAFYNTNGIEDAINTAVEQGSNYYAISYSPANKKYDGKYRKIKIALAEKGYRLSYRPGYFADDPTAPIKNSITQNISAIAMQHGSPQSRQLHFAARVVPVGPPKKIDNPVKVLVASKKKPIVPSTVDAQHYVIDFAVDSSDVRFILQENGDHTSRLNLMTSVYDENGSALSHLAFVWAADLKPDAYKNIVNGGVRLRQELDVPLKAVSVRLGIQDDMTTSLGTLELPVPVPPPTDVPRTVKHSLPEIEPD